MQGSGDNLVPFFFFFFPDWDPCPWAVQNHMGWQKAGHYSHRDCRIKASPIWSNSSAKCLPYWLTNQPIANESEMLIVHTPHKPFRDMAEHSFSHWDGCFAIDSITKTFIPFDVLIAIPSLPTSCFAVFKHSKENKMWTAVIMRTSVSCVV